MSGIAAQRRRRRPDAAGILGVAAATITLAGVSWYWYNRWASSSSPSSSSGASSSKDEQRQGKTPTDVYDSKSLARRPSLSISLPSHFDLSLPSHQEHLLRLYRSLSPLYLITLLPFSPHGNLELSGLATMLHSQVVGADTRRIVPYSTREGASAVARALGCDAHLEVHVEGRSRSSQTGGTKADLLVRTQALGLIRKNGKCRLVVVALLPALPAEQPETEDTAGQSGAQNGDGSHFALDLDNFVSSLLNHGSTINGHANGHKESSGSASSSEKAGATLRIIDTRTSTDPTSPRARSFSSGSRGGQEDLSLDAIVKAQRGAFDKAIDEMGTKMKELRRAWK